MKVGTDGVLLGAWTGIDPAPATILDIGAGTGLIALMLAQRTPGAMVAAVELDAAAYIQSVENFEQSPWADRLFCYHASFQDFANEIDEQYELIVSNPPFYSDSYKALPPQRAMARHTDHLDYQALLAGVAKRLSPTGSAAFIIPFSEEVHFLNMARQYRLLPNRITRVRGAAHSKVKRSLLQCSFKEADVVTTELIIETERHVYTPDYKDLVKNFYLKC